MSRRLADKYGAEETNLDLYKNKNVDWVSYPFTWLCYIVFLGCFWGLLHFSQAFTSADTWTIANVVHGLVSRPHLRLAAARSLISLHLCAFACVRCARVAMPQSTFIYLHWIKGSPDELGQGEYNALTMYEQIDAGIPWTRTKKFLMLVPTVL